MNFPWSSTCTCTLSFCHLRHNISGAESNSRREESGGDAEGDDTLTPPADNISPNSAIAGGVTSGSSVVWTKSATNLQSDSALYKHVSLCLQCCTEPVFTIMLKYSSVVIYTSVKIIKNEIGCRDDTVPKTVDTRRHCEED